MRFPGALLVPMGAFLARPRTSAYTACVRLRFTLTLALVSLAPLGARADMYRCTDASGGLTFTNVRPAGQRCVVIVRERRRPRASRPGVTPRRVSAASRDPNRYALYNAHIREAARLYQLPEAFLRAVIKVESDFVPDVVSGDGAMGLMQLMPRTAASMGVTAPFDPRQNILGGARYLRVLANRFNGDLVLTVAAYNAGGGAVTRYRGVPPYDETRRYVRRVLSFYYAFRRG
ncbi:MAG: lytic transglycosylase domain-containing protein [Deltaproteobacteria bacterium]|nr:lytic transglycosylase domain-containing protein [Deltaproteobacteria bacterium]